MQTADRRYIFAVGRPINQKTIRYIARRLYRSQAKVPATPFPEIVLRHQVQENSASATGSRPSGRLAKWRIGEIGAICSVPEGVMRLRRQGNQNGHRRRNRRGKQAALSQELAPIRNRIRTVDRASRRASNRCLIGKGLDLIFPGFPAIHSRLHLFALCKSHNENRPTQNESTTKD